MTDEDRFANELADLNNRYSHVPGPARWFWMAMTALAITDASKKKSETTEDEWIHLCRIVYRKVRSAVAQGTMS